MTWINEPLNIITAPNDGFFSDLILKGTRLIDSTVVATNAISKLTIDDPNFLGITPAQVSPLNVGINLPAAPSEVSVADIPALTTAAYLFDIPATPNAPQIKIAPNSVSIIAPQVGDLPTAPQLMTLTTNITQLDSWIIELVGSIKSNLFDRLTYATGLKPSIEAAIFGRAVDRENKQQSSGYANYMAAQAAMGWSSPSGQNKAAWIAFETDKKGKLSDINRDIMVKQAELEQSNTQKTIDALQALESQIYAMKDGFESKSLAIDGNEVQLYGTLVEAMFKRVETFNAINAMTLDKYKSDIEAYISTGKLDGELYAAQIQGYSATVSALSEQATGNAKMVIDSYAANLQGYEAVGRRVDGKDERALRKYDSDSRFQSEKAQLLMSQIEATNALNENLTNVALEKLRVMDSHNIGKYGALSEAQKAVGTILGQSAASLFNVMNLSQSWSHSVGWSGSESLSA
jgi:hypothetical protein